jgi:hypothetical protein
VIGDCSRAYCHKAAEHQGNVFAVTQLTGLSCWTVCTLIILSSVKSMFDNLQDPELLSFIDIECYCWSTVLAEFTPMINAGMVFCDRHYGGINYPKVPSLCCQI